MCGRYVRTTPADEVAATLEILGLAPPTNDLPAPSHNIAPSQKALAVVGAPREKAGNASLTGLRWGWDRATPRGGGSLIINARLEGLEGHSWTFGEALRSARCLIPANGYYEWQAMADAKQPWYFTTTDRPPFFFAGLTRGDAFVILTADACDEPTRRVHERAPCVVRPEHRAAWLDPAMDSAEVAVRIPVAYSSSVMRTRAWPVGRGVNSPRTDSPGLIEPVEADRPLFG